MDFIYWIICFILWGFFCSVIGYSFATRDSLLAIENVEQWINDTNSNQWVASYLYDEIKKDYVELLAEYNQYQGAIKALKDCNKFEYKKEDD